jgi:hypothetical protein
VREVSENELAVIWHPERGLRVVFPEVDPNEEVPSLARALLGCVELIETDPDFREMVVARYEAEDETKH